MPDESQPRNPESYRALRRSRLSDRAFDCLKRAVGSASGHMHNGVESPEKTDPVAELNKDDSITAAVALGGAAIGAVFVYHFSKRRGWE